MADDLRTINPASAIEMRRMQHQQHNAATTSSAASTASSFDGSPNGSRQASPPSSVVSTTNPHFHSTNQRLHAGHSGRSSRPVSVKADKRRSASRRSLLANSRRTSSTPAMGIATAATAVGGGGGGGGGIRDQRSSVRRMSSSIRRMFAGKSSSRRKIDAAFASSQDLTVLDSLKGLPLREGLQKLYKVRRDKFLTEMCMFLVFFTVFLTVILEAYPVSTAYVQDATLMELLLDEEFEGAQFKKNFAELETMPDYWDWLQGPLLNGMYATDWYNGEPLAPADQGFVQSYNRLVGPIELRQLRVSNHSCSQRRFLEFGNRFDTKDGTCYAEFRLGDVFQPSTEDKEPFGPPEDRNRYKYTSGHGLLWGLYGFGPQDYGDGGYVTYLDPSRDNASAVIDQLFADRWVDKGTRAVAHTMNLYNTNTRLLTVARVVVEFYTSGYVQGSFSFFSTRLVLYQSRLGLFRGVLEVVFVCLWLYQTQKEFKRFMWTHPHRMYFIQPRNLFEVLYLSVNLGVIISWLKYILSSRRSDFDVNTTTYVSYFETAYDFLIAFSFSAFCCLLGCLKLFKFLSINKRMSTLWVTLQHALYDLTLFFSGFIVIIIGFGLAGYLLFGHVLRDFHTVQSSISSLTRFMLSDFDYIELSISRPLLAPVFFWLYNAVVFLVVMNMFIAIITLYFEEVHRAAKLSDRWKEGMPDLLYDLTKVTRRFFRNHIRNRCYWMYQACCCTCLRKKRKLRKAMRGSGVGGGGVGGNTPATARVQSIHYGTTSHKPLSVTGLEMQMEVWEREETFERLIRECARAAKRRHVSVDLFRYFELAFRDVSETSNYYVGLSELCMVTRHTPSCQHEDCLARAVLLSYAHLKEVVLLHGQERTSTASFAERPTTRFWVVKINKWGRKQERVLAIDSQRKELHGFDRSMNLKRVLPLTALVQIDKSVPDPRRLNLVFAESVATQYHLLFNMPEERTRFILKVLEASGRHPDKLTSSKRRSMVTGRSVNTDSAAAAFPDSKADPSGGGGGRDGMGGGLRSPSGTATGDDQLSSALMTELRALRQEVRGLKHSMTSMEANVKRQSVAILPEPLEDRDDW